jgi:hypothetical protein
MPNQFLMKTIRNTKLNGTGNGLKDFGEIVRELNTSFGQAGVEYSVSSPNGKFSEDLFQKKRRS